MVLVVAVLVKVRGSEEGQQGCRGESEDEGRSNGEGRGGRCCLFYSAGKFHSAGRLGAAAKFPFLSRGGKEGKGWELYVGNKGLSKER